MAKKLLAMLLSIVMILALGTAAFADGEPTDEEMAAWAEANGYVKLAPDLATSATEAKQGGVNYGAIEWTPELQAEAVKEWLKGGTFLADASFAQDDSGYNYRNMFQMATCYNNVPNNTNLELVLDADSLSLLGASEAGTSKTLQFAANPAVSIAWSKQLNVEDEEAGYNYFGSYGLTYNGTVKVYGPADLETEEGQNALINLFDKYYPTLASTWGAYSAKFAGLTDEAEIRAAKLDYITTTLNGGAMVIYEIIPEKIIITCPFMLCMIPQYNNAQAYTTCVDGNYAYALDIRPEFLNDVIAYKNEFLADEANKAAVEEYYGSAMYQMLDSMATSFGMSANIDVVLMPDNAAGIKTQTTWTPAA